MCFRQVREVIKEPQLKCIVRMTNLIWYVLTNRQMHTTLYQGSLLECAQVPGCLLDAMRLGFEI